MGVTVRHLNRLLRKYARDSAGGALREARLRWARRRLAADPTLSVKEVAFQAGFSSQSHFTQSFKKRFGKLPREVTAADLQ